MSRVAELRRDRRASWVIGSLLVVAVALLPMFRPPLDGFTNDAILALAYVVMALGLNLVVGFAGLLDLGYVAFYAFGLMVTGWWASDFYSSVNNEEGIHVGVSSFVENLPGIHLNLLILIVGAIIICAIAGVLIGLPTLRLRGDYIAIVTLAFGEIIGRSAVNGDEIILADVPLVGGALENTFGPDQPITAGRQGITPVDKIDLPFVEAFTSLNLRPWYWVGLAMVAIVLFVNFRLRDSRLGRAWVALREDEVAAVSMGVPAVKTKLLAYGTGAAFGGVSGAFLGSFNNTVNADQFQFFFSILILGMVILGGLGSIWGTVLGGIALTFINFELLPRLNSVPSDVGLDFDLSEINFGIYGFLLVIMMIMRPQGLLPERRRKMELTAEADTTDATLYTAQA
jgi:branched-chain amino acid transport system permease protein